MQLFNSTFGIRAHVIIIIPSRSLSSSIKQSIMGNSNSLYIYNATISNTKAHRCFRADVFKLAEEYCGEVRRGVASDGIFYRNNDLVIRLVFVVISDAKHFQTKIHQLPSTRRKRRSEGNDIQDLVVNDSIQRIMVTQYFVDNNLSRIFYSDYAPMLTEEEQSPDCDTVSVYSTTSDVFIDDTVRMRLVSREDSLQLFKKKAEKCHLKSQSAFPAIKNERENILFMDRFLHEHFDGICTTDGVPHFVLEYGAHNATAIQHPINTGSQVINSTVYETSVAVTFLDDEIANNLKPLFRNYSQVPNDNRRIRFNLLFEHPDSFRNYAEFKANETRAKWQSLAGVNEE